MGSFSRFGFGNKGILPYVYFSFKAPLTDFQADLQSVQMRKYQEAPQIFRRDTRTGDSFLRLCCVHIGSIRKAEKVAGLKHNHLHSWFNDPNRGFSPTVALKVALTFNMPVEALLFRWVPIKDLDFWKWLKRK